MATDSKIKKVLDDEDEDDAYEDEDDEGDDDDTSEAQPVAPEPTPVSYFR